MASSFFADLCTELLAWPEAATQTMKSPLLQGRTALFANPYTLLSTYAEVYLYCLVVKPCSVSPCSIRDDDEVPDEFVCTICEQQFAEEHQQKQQQRLLVQQQQQQHLLAQQQQHRRRLMLLQQQQQQQQQQELQQEQQQQQQQQVSPAPQAQQQEPGAGDGATMMELGSLTDVSAPQPHPNKHSCSPPSPQPPTCSQPVHEAQAPVHEADVPMQEAQAPVQGADIQASEAHRAVQEIETYVVGSGTAVAAALPGTEAPVLALPASPLHGGSKRRRSSSPCDGDGL
eukprot:1161415-Pelagomonas_calceolata.AAC.6